jgi:hypothetical protein
MSSSVSSERAFSQGGITISKRHNCLKGDIVEALQCIKCAIRNDLLFQASVPTLASESDDADNDVGNVGIGADSGEPGEESDSDEFTWNGLLIEDEDEPAVYCSD